MATISRHQTVIFGIFTHLTAESAITREIQLVLTNRGYRRSVPVPPPPGSWKVGQCVLGHVDIQAAEV